MTAEWVASNAIGVSLSEPHTSELSSRSEALPWKAGKSLVCFLTCYKLLNYGTNQRQLCFSTFSGDIHLVSSASLDPRLSPGKQERAWCLSSLALSTEPIKDSCVSLLFPETYSLGLW